MLIAEANGVPVAVHVESASPHETKLIEPTLKKRQCNKFKSKRLLYDKAADSKALRKNLWYHGLRLICPFRKRDNKPRKRLSQRDQTFYAHRYKIERAFSWLKSLRRLATRYEYHPDLFEGFWQLGIVFTILRRL